jgi:hypothetical protein
MKEPVDHILRPQLPWRAGDAAITECGINAANVSTLTRESFFARLKDYGRSRTAMLTCMTCSDTAARHGTWDDDPRNAIDREILWEGARWLGHANENRGVRLKNELLAIASLVEKYREEFDAMVTAIEQRRAWNEMKATNAAKPKLRPVGGV